MNMRTSFFLMALSLSVACGDDSSGGDTDAGSSSSTSSSMPTSTTDPGSTSGSPTSSTGTTDDTVGSTTDDSTTGTAGDDTGTSSSTGAGESSSSTGAAISFASDIWPIIEANCGGGNCHHGGNDNDAGGLNLEQANAYANLVDQPASQPDSMDRVEPMDAANSYFFRKIVGDHEDVPGGDGQRMPRGMGAEPLAQADIDLVEAWILGGAAE